MYFIQVRVTDDFWTAWIEISRCIRIYWYTSLCWHNLCTVYINIYTCIYTRIDVQATFHPQGSSLLHKAPPIGPNTDCPVAALLQDDCQFCPDFSESLLLERLSHVPEDGRSGAFNSDIQVVMAYDLDVSKMYSYCNFLGHHSDCFFDCCFAKVKVLTDLFVHTLNKHKFVSKAHGEILRLGGYYVKNRPLFLIVRNPWKLSRTMSGIGNNGGRCGKVLEMRSGLGDCLPRWSGLASQAPKEGIQRFLLFLKGWRSNGSDRDDHNSNNNNNNNNSKKKKRKPSSCLLMFAGLPDHSLDTWPMLCFAGFPAGPWQTMRFPQRWKWVTWVISHVGGMLYEYQDLLSTCCSWLPRDWVHWFGNGLLKLVKHLALVWPVAQLVDLISSRTLDGF